MPPLSHPHHKSHPSYNFWRESIISHQVTVKTGDFQTSSPVCSGLSQSLPPLPRRTSNFFISYGFPLALSRGGGAKFTWAPGDAIFSLKKALHPHPRPVLNFNSYLFHAFKDKYFGQKWPRRGNKFTSSKNREDIQLLTENESVKNLPVFTEFDLFLPVFMLFCPL